MDDWKKVSRDNWKYRRRVVFSVLLWACFCVTYILWRGDDVSLYRDAIIALLGAIVTIIGTYVFGAAFDDNSKRRYQRPPSDGEEQ